MRYDDYVEEMTIWGETVFASERVLQMRDTLCSSIGSTTFEVCKGCPFSVKTAFREKGLSCNTAIGRLGVEAEKALEESLAEVKSI